MNIPKINAYDIIKQYDVILLDSYGVLLTHSGPINGAKTFIEQLNAIQKEYYIVTNDASKTLKNSSLRFKKNGIPIEEKRIISSSSLLKGYFQKENLCNSRCAVLGPPDSIECVKNAGGKIVPLKYGVDFDVLVVCDEAGFPFLETMDTALTLLYSLLDRGENVKLISPNPDLIYPKDTNTFGFTSKAITLVLETALRMRYPKRTELSFISLGKPNAPIFEEVYSRSGTMNMVMIGDQLLTDIKGANSFGIDSVLIGTGITNISKTLEPENIIPKYLLESLKL